MTQDEIMRMAEQAGMFTHKEVQPEIQAFAKLVAEKTVEGKIVMTPEEYKFVWDKAQAEEREACAQICETLWTSPSNGMSTEEQVYGDKCADEIRARGETK